jgi:hypothetical protein
MLLGGTPSNEKFDEYVFMVLGTLMCLRLIFAALAVIYAGLSFIQGPKFLSVTASIFAAIALLTIFIMM